MVDVDGALVEVLLKRSDRRVESVLSVGKVTRLSHPWLGFPASTGPRHRQNARQAEPRNQEVPIRVDVDQIGQQVDLPDR